LNQQFVAVGARELKSAQDFAKLFNIPKAYGSYEELAKDKDVEVVYIGTVNSQHLPAAKLMLENGKHILMEKPLDINTKRNQQKITFKVKNNISFDPNICIPVQKTRSCSHWLSLRSCS
jgi:dihydrodiol dehydrogenase / D-xylose 1-dehydrogenase (NADP)